ncbi:MAG TPA: peptidylprolyl isomerase [Anaerolineales bacterium]|nr:peptidylprolyl isomerase [Anaerolineales bacterium]
MKKLILILALGLSACGGTPTPTSPVDGGETTTLPAPSPTVEPSPTPVPLAASVNGQSLLLSDYEIEVARYEAGAASLGRDLSREGDYRSRVLEALIEKALILQAAQAAGITMADADVQAAYDQIVAARGGQAGFEQWLAANLYTPDQFRAELRDGMLANAAQSQVAAGIPAEAEQVHARHILVASREEVDKILAELAAGADFATLAVNQSLDASRINGGDLGWFPVGGLTQPEVSQAAFALQPNEISQPVQSALGFHIVQTLEREVRQLSTSALTQARQQTLAAWRAELWKRAQIQKFAP